jgi:asparagine synthase (glutamine-hydrolysing)
LRESLADELSWLRPAAREELRRLERRCLEEPAGWGAAVRNAATRRATLLPVMSMRRLARDSGVEVAAPLLDPRFVGALARTGGRGGWGSRTAAMRAIAGDLLPDRVLSRRSKAHFNRCFFGDEAHAFAERWSGKGVDEDLVDAEALRREWLSPVPDFRTALLLQAAWLHDKEARVAWAA